MSEVAPIAVVRTVSDSSWAWKLGEKGFEQAGTTLDFQYQGHRISLLSGSEQARLRSRVGRNATRTVASRLHIGLPADFSRTSMTLKPLGLFIHEDRRQKPKGSTQTGYLNMNFTEESSAGILAEREALINFIGSEVGTTAWRGSHYEPTMRVARLWEGPLVNGAVEALEEAIPSRIDLNPGEIILRSSGLVSA